VRGIVAVVGSEPMTRVVLRDSAGRAITMSGSEARMIGRLSGLEVWAAGARSGQTLTVTRFLVRAVDRAPAEDGDLVERGAALALLRADGTDVKLVDVPTALRAHLGDRVWVTLSENGGVQSFGVIEDRP
jgi:hypothetical protein